MDTSQLKGIFQKLSVFKSFSVYILPACLVLLAVILFVPSRVMSSRLKTRMNKQSIKKAKTIKSLRGKAVSSKQCELERDYQDAYAADANEIALLARRSSQRELLSYRIFPEPDPNETSTLIFREFGEGYETYKKKVPMLLPRL